MRRILSKSVQGRRSSSDGTSVGRAVQLLELSEFRSPRTRCVYDGGVDTDFIDVDHWDEIKEKRASVRS